MTEIEERRRRNSILETVPSEKQNGSGETEAMKEVNPETLPEGPKDVDMDVLSGAMSALNFVPPSVRFGRGGGRARGFSRS
jgi:hypothetical protein